MRLLGLRHYTEVQKRDLLRFIDWLLQLSAELQLLCEARVAALEEKKMATYISTFERKAHAIGVEEGVEIGRQGGLLTGLEFGLRLRFGEAGLALMPALQQIADPDVLESLLGVLAECASLADFERAIPGV